MTSETIDYLTGIIDKYKAGSVSSYVEAELANYIISWGKACDPEIFISGSSAKQTAIGIASDYDYFVSLSSDCNVNQKGIDEISNSLHFHLQKKYPNNIRRQNVSTRINIYGLNIDITAGTKITGYQNYHWLYRSKDRSRKQTNVKMHINDIAKSGRTKEIKLIKIWRELNKLEFPSIYLEYLLIKKILLNKPMHILSLSDNICYIFRELSKTENNPMFTVVEDPANTTNILSDLISQSEKQKVVKASQIALQSKWGEVFY